ncbi:hypothetical protein AK812_SmicGene35083 [Symbiodinium microadriaticum]|uniref:Uncharacterized protein n=1 Tax=Symbiodinium microadriaticum TaxID=2951 RepID=A0A1Q9CMD2_SYMMI|nr:hypothetical protein AK812_SmicGene35083 [Symbiodinium microadriaticum]
MHVCVGHFGFHLIDRLDRLRDISFGPKQGQVFDEACMAERSIDDVKGLVGLSKTRDIDEDDDEDVFGHNREATKSKQQTFVSGVWPQLAVGSSQGGTCVRPFDVVRWLLEAGADENLTNNEAGADKNLTNNVIGGWRLEALRDAPVCEAGADKNLTHNLLEALKLCMWQFDRAGGWLSQANAKLQVMAKSPGSRHMCTMVLFALGLLLLLYVLGAAGRRNSAIFLAPGSP